MPPLRAIVAATLVTGCHLISGLTDLGPEGSGRGGAGGNLGGGGGSGGDEGGMGGGPCGGQALAADALSGNGQVVGRSVAIGPTGQVGATFNHRGNLVFRDDAIGPNMSFDTQQIGAMGFRLGDTGAPAWTFSAGGDAEAGVQQIAFGADGSAYLCGSYFGTLGNAEFSLSPPIASRAGFVVKLDPMGQVDWAAALDSNNSAGCYGLAVTSDRLFVVGEFTDDLSFPGDYLDPGGTHGFVLSLPLDDMPGTGRALGPGMVIQSIAVDEAGGLVLAGYHTQAQDLDGHPLDYVAGRDVFVLGTDRDLQVTWAQAATGNNADSAEWVATGPGGVLVVGSFRQKLSVGMAEITAQSGMNAFVWTLDDDGNHRWLRALESDTEASGHAAAQGPAGELFAGIRFAGESTYDGHPWSAVGNSDALVLR
ncbi:MAG: hypothetical protein KC731_02755, partial [Myxococcales bacterium]|nr:hypothetical protein [Myxococcales bacterium]